MKSNRRSGRAPAGSGLDNDVRNVLNAERIPLNRLQRILADLSERGDSDAIEKNTQHLNAVSLTFLYNITVIDIQQLLNTYRLLDLVIIDD